MLCKRRGVDEGLLPATRRPRLSFDVCPHIDINGIACNKKLQRNCWRHIDDFHRNCAVDCMGCQTRKTGAHWRSIIPANFEVPYHGTVCEHLGRSLDYDMLFSQERCPWEELPDSEKANWHKDALQLLGICYRSDDLQDVLTELIPLADLEVTPKQKSPLEIFAFCMSLRLPASAIPTVLKFLNSPHSTKAVLQQGVNLLTQQPPIEEIDSCTFRVSFRATLAAVIDEAVASGRDLNNCTLTVKLTLDAGAVFRSSGSKHTHLTIAALEDVDRGGDLYKSPKGVHMIYVQRGKDIHYRTSTELYS